MPNPIQTFTHLDEFLTWEAQQPERWEYVDGAARMMVGGTFNHARVISATHVALRSRLRPCGCDVFTDSVKLKAAGSIFYPDLMAICPRLEQAGTVAERATLIVEVLSPSTRGRETSRKLLRYMQLPELQAILLLEQDEWAADVYRRVGGVWDQIEVAGPNGVITLEEPAVSIPLAEIYADLP